MTAISEDEFSFYMQQLGPFQPSSALAVATSGGPDSLCLTLLMAKWCQQYHYSLTALIVDHKLRPESTIEAQQTKVQLANLGVNTVILTWYGDKPLTRIQELARQKRYELMLNWCLDHHHAYLCTGHHLQDQFETVLWRLWRGSDIWGLAGISAQINNRHITICRPLLQVTKQRIETTLKLTSLVPVRDPSNTDKKFARVAVRSKLAQLPILPLRTLGQLRTNFDAWRQNFIKLHVESSTYGFLMVDFVAFSSLSLPFQQYLLNHLITVIGHQFYPISPGKLVHTIQKILKSPQNIHTQGGCILYVRRHKLLIIREWTSAQILPLSGLQHLLIKWDGRFDVNTDKLTMSTLLQLRPIGKMGWLQICLAHQTVSFLDVPYYARLALPSLWCRDKMIAICHFPQIHGGDLFLTNPTFNPVTPLLPPHFKTLKAWS